MPGPAPPPPEGLRRAVALVAAANLAYFAVEISVAVRIDAVSLFADSIDFLEDAAVNLLIVLALGWSAAARARIGLVMAGTLLLPALGLLWTLWEKVQAPASPDPLLLAGTGLGALAVNLACAFALARFSDGRGSLTRAAFLSSRNDALANVAIIGAAGLTLAWPSPWPDVAVGLAIAAMNADAARQVWQAARREQIDAAA